MALETVLAVARTDESGDGHALADAVVDVAGPAGATVVVLFVFSEPDYTEAVSDRDDESVSPSPDALAATRESVVRLVDALEAAGIDHVVRGEVGEPVERILTEAEEGGVDLVFVGSERRSPTGKVIFGSTAQDVMLNAPCPVVFVREDR